MVRQDDFFGFQSYTIENGALALRVTEYGASILSMRIRGEEMVLSFPALAEYESWTENDMTFAPTREETHCTAAAKGTAGTSAAGQAASRTTMP